MTYRLTTTDSRIGGVENPLTDPDADEREDLLLDADKELEVEDRELAEALVDTYEFLVFVAEPTPAESDRDSDSDSDSEDGGEEDICGVEMDSGEICERPADECPYHGNDSE